MVTLKIRRDNLKRFSPRIFRVTMSYQTLVKFELSMTAFIRVVCGARRLPGPLVRLVHPIDLRACPIRVKQAFIDYPR
jgi:hypothetical protein